MLDLPPTAILGMSGSGAFNGMFPVWCARCKASLVLLTWHPPTHPAIRQGIFISFAAAIAAPAVVLDDANDAMTLLTPDNGPGPTYAYRDGWDCLIGLHRCRGG